MLKFILPSLFLACLSSVYAATPAESVAASFSLTTSTTLPFPTATESSSDAQALIVSEWGLSKGRIQDGASDLAFVNDPFPNVTTPGVSTNINTTGPVLQVTYPSGSFNNNTGGAQLYNLWNTSDGSTFGSMMLSYEVAFDSDFDWVKGGKLPGLRGGLNSTGCSGGKEATGKDCFSTRLMWRADGLGEVYAYIPETKSLCADSSITCNDDFGISISRGAFSFSSGTWNRITLLVQLNNPASKSNGQVQLYFNDILAISHQGLRIRTASTLSAGGLYFSTFFGGDDDSWATPNTTHTYFRNLRLWGSSDPSTLSSIGTRSSSAAIDVVLLSLTVALLSLWI